MRMIPCKNIVCDEEHSGPLFRSPEPIEADRYQIAIVRLREPPRGKAAEDWFSKSIAPDAGPNPELPPGILEVTVQATLQLGDDREMAALLVLSAAEAMNLGADLFGAGQQAAEAAAVPQPVKDVPTERMPVDEGPGDEG